MNFRTSLNTLALALIALIAYTRGPVLAALLLFAFLGSQVVGWTPRPVCGTATLILPILTGAVMEAFKFKVPELSYFSMEAKPVPVKFGQQVISHLASVPSVSDHTPGTSLAASPQDLKTLVQDIKITIDLCKKVVIKVPSADVGTLLLSDVFKQEMTESGQALARAVVDSALGTVVAANFSHSKTVTSGNEDFDSLVTLRKGLNTQKALTPRYFLGGTDVVANIANDPRVMSGLQYNQRITDDPYVRLQNIEGFSEVREYPNFPTTANLTGFGFEKRAIHIAVRQMMDSLDMARQLGIPTPILDHTEVDELTGLVFTSFLWIDVNTHDIYMAVVVMFGVRGGIGLSDDANPSSGAADAGMDPAGLRLISA